MNEREHPGYLSACHSADVRMEDGGPDFLGGENTGAYEVRTCWFVCTTCGEPCNVEKRPSASTPS